MWSAIKQWMHNAWTLNGARALINELLPDMQRIGWGLGLHGSVLYKGVSGNDVDIIAYPMCSADDPSIDALRSTMKKHGFRVMFTREEVVEHWRKKGSLDSKHVEVWRKGWRRVDVFILR